MSSTQSLAAGRRAERREVQSPVNGYEEHAVALLESHITRLDVHRRSVLLFYLLFGLLVGFFLGLAGAKGVLAATPGMEQAETGVTLADVTSSALLLRTKTPGRYLRAPTVATDIDVDVSGPVVRTRVTQRFQNPSDGWVEGTYVFPLPDGAAVDTLKMMIGKRFIEGRIEERKEARRIYREAKANGQKAALVEQQRPNMFTNSVANIGPGESVVVQIEYQDTVRQSGDEFRLRIPLVAAPRYEPESAPALTSALQTPAPRPVSVTNSPPLDGGATDVPVRNPALGPTNPITFHLKLDAGFDLGPVESPHHKISVARNGPQSAVVTLAAPAYADRDFELTWKAKTGAAPAVTLYKERMDNRDYLLTYITPPVQTDRTQTENPAREVIFVLDNSGSMAGASMRQAKASLKIALERLSTRDYFNVIRFDNTMDQVFERPRQATETSVAQATGWIDAITADGGTEMLPALRAALKDATPDDRSRLRQVIFLTDGAVSNEGHLFSVINDNLGRSRIFTVGIGSAPNSYFMTRAAEIGRGTFTHIGSPDQIAPRMAELLEKLENPAITDLEAHWPRGAKAEAWPNPLPDLYHGEPVVLAARLAKATGDLTITGRFKGKPWKISVPLVDAREGTGIAKLWARRKIAALETMRSASRGNFTEDETVLNVALAHGLVSRLTSLVAVDVTPTRPAGERLASMDVPVNLPAGWNFDKVFGPRPGLRDAKLQEDTIAMTRYAQLLQTSDTKSDVQVSSKTRGVVLPQGATLADKKIYTGFLILFMSLTLILTSALLRHLGQAYGPKRKLKFDWASRKK